MKKHRINHCFKLPFFSVSDLAYSSGIQCILTRLVFRLDAPRTVGDRVQSPVEEKSEETRLLGRKSEDANYLLC